MRDQEERRLGTAAENQFSAFQKDTCISRVLAGKHTLVIGATGSGKTFFMANIANLYFKRFIFVNPQLEESVDSICTSGYDSASEVLEAVIDGEKAIEFVPDENDEIAILELEEIRRGLFEIAEEMNIESGTWWMNFILDEAQTYAWKGSRNDVDNFGRRGRRFGIRSWFLTQRPQNLSSTLINNVELQIIFKTGSYESQYFKTYKIPIEEHSAWLKQDYHYCIYDGFEMQECEPIKAGR